MSDNDTATKAELKSNDDNMKALIDQKVRQMQQEYTNADATMDANLRKFASQSQADMVKTVGEIESDL